MIPAMRTVGSLSAAGRRWQSINFSVNSITRASNVTARRRPRTAATPDGINPSPAARQALEHCLQLLLSGNIDAVVEFLPEEALYDTNSVRDLM
jgi:hypothetical protein